MKFEKNKRYGHIYFVAIINRYYSFYAIPYLMCIYNSLMSGGHFVGLDNYIAIFKNKSFLYALKNTMILQL